MTIPKPYNDTFEMGAMAYRIGLNCADCPFGQKSKIAKVWIKGFNTAKIKHKRDKKNVEDVHGVRGS